MSRTVASAQIKNRIFHIDGKPRIVISADYPYYRDHVDRWAPKLAALRKLGVEVVTFYIPWRHHAYLEKGRQKFDLTGVTLPNRNVVRFTKLAAQNDLLVVVKPGPFIHAETDGGGFPDWAIPGKETCTCEAEVNHRNKPRQWITGDIMPSPTGTLFLSLVEEWYRAVDAAVIAPLACPKGPIIAIQIANEGLFTDAGATPLEFDFSNSSVKLFQDYCRTVYGTAAEYNRLHASSIKSFADIQPPRGSSLGPTVAPPALLALMDWRTYQNRFTETFFSRLRASIKTRRIPCVTNAALHYAPDKNIDYWICRNSYYNLKDVHPGFTNWVGVVSCDAKAFDKYLFAIKYVKGINWEENWGFSKIYDPRYIHPIVPYYQTLLAMAAGARGFNVYTGVATSNWDSHIDSKHERPYPATPPIDDNGAEGLNAGILRELCRFFKAEEKHFVASSSGARIAYILDLHYSAAASMEHSKFKRLRHLHDAGSLVNFLHACRDSNTAFDLMNAYHEDESVIAECEYAVLPCAFFMSRRLQETAIRLLRRGTGIFWFGEIPSLDETMEPCTLLADYLRVKNPGHMIKIGGLTRVMLKRWTEVLQQFRLAPPCPHGDVFYLRRTVPMTGLSSCFVFSRSARNQRVRIDLPEGRLECNLTSHSALACTIQDGILRSALVKSVDEMTGHRMPVQLLLNGRGLNRSKALDGYLLPD